MKSLSIVESLSAACIEITSICNLSCRYCYNDSRMDKAFFMPYDVIRNFLSVARECTGFSSVIISGGEPFLHPDIERICALLAELNLEIRINTNGTHLTEDRIRFLAKFRPSLQITLDSPYEAMNDFYKPKGAYKKIISTLRLLQKEYDMKNVTIRCNLTNEFLDSETALNDYFSLLKEYGVQFLYFSLINGKGRAVVGDYPTKYKDRDKLIDFKRNVLSCAQKYGIHAEAPILGVCQTCPYFSANKYSGSYTIHITPDGNVYPCSALAYSKYIIGNITDSGSKIICEDKLAFFQNMISTQLHVIEKCSNCGYNKVCGKGCPGEQDSSDNSSAQDSMCAFRKNEIARLLRSQVGSQK